MLIRSDAHLGFELEFSLKSPLTHFFLRIPKVCEVFNSPDFGLVCSPWSEVARMEAKREARRSSQTTV